MFGLNSVQSAFSSLQSASASFKNKIATIEIATAPPKEGPGFDGLDVDGGGGVSYEEFWAAAQAKRDGGTLTVTKSVAQTSIEAASVEAVSVSAEQSLIARLGAVTSFDAAGEFERVMAKINGFGARSETALASSVAVNALEVRVEENAGPPPSDPEQAEARAQALAAVSEPAAFSLSLDPYERATQRVFTIADRDRDGEINRSEFDFMNNALFGNGRSVGTSVTVTAVESEASFGYAAATASSQTALSLLSNSVYAKA